MVIDYKIVRVVVEVEVVGEKEREVVVFENDGESVSGVLSEGGKVDVFDVVLEKWREREVEVERWEESGGGYDE